jgi:hypothetical protein
MGARINMVSGQFNEDRLETAIRAICGMELESFEAVKGKPKNSAATDHASDE